MRTAFRLFVLVSATLVVTLSGYAYAAPADASEEAARAVAAQAIEMEGIFETYPVAQLVGGRTDSGEWSFEIVSEGTELGFVVLSSDLEVIEIGRFDNQPPLGEDDGDPPLGEDDGDAERGSLVELLVPGAEGSSVFAWATLGIFLFVVWPGSASRNETLGRLLAIAMVVWGVTWLVFWQYVDASQLVLWMTNLVALTVVSVAVWRGEHPRFEGRGEGRAISFGLIVILLWLVWLTLSGSLIEDSTIWAARGGRYLVDNLAFPYGILGEGATYGPVQYLIHAPLTLVWPPGEFGTDSFFAARIVAAIAVVALGVGAKVALGWRTSRASAGAVAVLILPWFVSTVDVANVSHLVPIAFTVWAFVLIGRAGNRNAAVSGVLLGLGAGAMFVPAFAAPALLVAARDRWRQALGGMVGVGIAVLALLVVTGADLATVWTDTVRFQETAYSAEGGLSFWGRFGLEEWRWVGKVLHIGLLIVSIGGLYRFRTQAAAFLAAGVGIGGVLLWKGHIGPWGYLTWFVPMLVIGALLTERDRSTCTTLAGTQSTEPIVDTAYG